MCCFKQVCFQLFSKVRDSVQFHYFNGNLFHSFGAAVLKALSPKDLYLVLGTDNRFFESDCKEQEGI